MMARQTLITSTTTRQGEQQLMTMKNPPHPGGVVLRQCIEPSGLTITDAATALGVTRNTLSELVNGKRGISPEMAVRLSKVFGGAEDGWLGGCKTNCVKYVLLIRKGSDMELKQELV